MSEKVMRGSSITSFAVGPLGLGGPVADATELVEPEPGRTGVFLGHALHAGVEDVADGRIGMGVEAVQPRAQVTGTFGRL